MVCLGLIHGFQLVLRRNLVALDRLLDPVALSHLPTCNPTPKLVCRIRHLYLFVEIGVDDLMRPLEQDL
jgi:hypothetical protein